MAKLRLLLFVAISLSLQIFVGVLAWTPPPPSNNPTSSTKTSASNRILSSVSEQEFRSLVKIRASAKTSSTSVEETSKNKKRASSAKKNNKQSNQSNKNESKNSTTRELRMPSEKLQEKLLEIERRDHGGENLTRKFAL